MRNVLGFVRRGLNIHLFYNDLRLYYNRPLVSVRVCLPLRYTSGMAESQGPRGTVEQKKDKKKDKKAGGAASVEVLAFMGWG